MVKKSPDPAPKLTERQMAQLRGIVIGRDPWQFELDYALWTRELAQEVIERKFRA